MRMWVLCDQLWKTCEGAFHHAMSCKHMGICNCMKHFTHQNKLIMWHHMWKEIKPQGLYVKSPYVKKCVKHNILRKCLYTTCEMDLFFFYPNFFCSAFWTTSRTHCFTRKGSTWQKHWQTRSSRFSSSLHRWILVLQKSNDLYRIQETSCFWKPKKRIKNIIITFYCIAPVLQH